MGDWGTKVTVTGKGIDSTTPEDYLIWSKYPNVKIKAITSPTTVTISSGYNTTYTITHNLGYYPIFNLFFEDIDGNIIRIPGKSGDTKGTCAIIDSETINAITVRIGSQSASYSGTTYNLYHFIYYDERT